jgi:hypothetical protein
MGNEPVRRCPLSNSKNYLFPIWAFWGA